MQKNVVYQVEAIKFCYKLQVKSYRYIKSLKEYSLMYSIGQCGIMKKTCIYNLKCSFLLVTLVVFSFPGSSLMFRSRVASQYKSVPAANQLIIAAPSKTLLKSRTHVFECHTGNIYEKTLVPVSVKHTALNQTSRNYNFVRVFICPKKYKRMICTRTVCLLTSYF